MFMFPSHLTPRHLLGLAGVILGAVLTVFGIRFTLEGVRRSVVRRSIGDIRAIGAALESYRATNGAYPLISPRQPAQVLIAHLVPSHIAHVPGQDAWNRPFFVSSSRSSFELSSFGADGRDGPNISDGPFHTPDADIVFRNGHFVRYPSWLSHP